VHETLLTHHKSHDRLIEFRRVDGSLAPHVHEHHRSINARLPAVRGPEVRERLLLQEHQDDVLLLRAELKPDRSGRDIVVRNSLAADALPREYMLPLFSQLPWE